MVINPLQVLTRCRPPVGQDADPSLHRGFAFVQFAESGEAEKAVAELNGAKTLGVGEG